MKDFFDAQENEEDLNVELTSKKISNPQNEGHLTVDVFQTENDIVLQSTIAGAKSEDIDISVTKDMVTIKGYRHPEQGVKAGDYFHRELFWGPFSRAVILPVDIDADRAKASMRNGVLTIRLPKIERTRRPAEKKVKIS